MQRICIGKETLIKNCKECWWFQIKQCDGKPQAF
jgi:hypothetical protein